MQKGEALLATSTRERAMEEFQKAIDITPDIAHKFMVSLREKNVRYVVAPYEADAQMAYLSRKGYVDAVITDDSDLLAFGCQRVFFKMDKTGQGYEISRDNFPKCTKIRLRNWTSESTSRLYCFCLSWYFNCVRKQKKKKRIHSDVRSRWLRLPRLGRWHRCGQGQQDPQPRRDPHREGCMSISIVDFSCRPRRN